MHTDSKRHFIFVYGTLLKSLGGGSHRLETEETKFLGEGKICADLYYGCYPGIFLSTNPTHQVYGELYETGITTLASLDRLEGYDPITDQGSDYLRREVEVIFGQKKQKAFVYISTKMKPYFKYLKSGNFKKEYPKIREREERE